MLIQELAKLNESRMSVAEFSDKSDAERVKILWMWTKPSYNDITLKEWSKYLDAHIAAVKSLKEEFQSSLPVADLPKNVLDAAEKVKAVLKKFKIDGARISVDLHDYEPRNEHQSAGHYGINVELGRTNIENRKLVDALNTVVPYKERYRKGDIQIMPCGSVYPAPKNVIR